MSGLQLLLGLSILVVLHELGHFLAARAFKTRVEKFYLFFDFLFPFPGLLNFALFKKKIGDTEYGLGWFPLGGYVKIAGMMDESMDEDSLKLPPKPDEYRSKKNWQKLIIMLGGIIMNVLVGWLIYSQLLFWKGEIHIAADGTKYGIHCDSIGIMAGFRDGDIILSHDGGQKFESFTNIPRELLLDEIKDVQVQRNGQKISFNLPDDFKKRALEYTKSYGFFEPRLLCLVDTFTAESVVKDKLKKGDQIIGINDSVINYFTDVRATMAKQSKDVELVYLRDSNNTRSMFLGGVPPDSAHITFLRGKDTMHCSVKMPISGMLGFYQPRDVKDSKGAIAYNELQYGFIGSFGAGWVKVYKTVRDYFKQFKLIFSPTIKGYKQLGGVGSMASMYGTHSEEWDWIHFWTVTAFISLVLAVMNLLPIPMLDGGYVIILLIEMAIGRPLNEKLLENIQRVGFIIIIFLMVYANGNDLYKWVLDRFFHQ